MTQGSSTDIDWKTIGWFAGGIALGLFVGAVFLGPVVQRIKDKKKNSAKTPAPINPTSK